MKTAEELFEKHHYNVWEKHGLVMNEGGFKEAFTEHDAEIIAKIKGMIKKLRKELNIAKDWIERAEIKHTIATLTKLLKEIEI